ncbi:Rv1733c family protein [Streptomyces silvisoli]|uniref:Pilus assembly protein n=1 Tax=Streptomyces silvisoli TaxID=3034235 RepID=A0ABT5ZUV7_9ACTN|nr:hypothetical protein [Streptomyces silvisoli]MDF3293609.1 hypothetical protein [Streptomyces silvisoli]
MSAQTWRLMRRHCPLRRGSDVVEACVGLLTVLLAAVFAPLAGVVAAEATSALLVHQQQGWHRTAAVLTGDAAFTTTGAADTGQAEATVRWSAPDRSTRSAATEVPAGTKAGTSTTVWIDAKGRLRHPPLGSDDRAALADLAGGCVAIGVCALAAGARRAVVRFELERHRARAWEREWAEVEPRWTHGHA